MWGVSFVRPTGIFASVCLLGFPIPCSVRCRIATPGISGQLRTQCHPNERGKSMKTRYLASLLSLAAVALLAPLSRAQAPTFTISPPPQSTVKFNVKASVAIEGTFDKWDATLTFSSVDVTSGVLDIKIQAASVNTGSGMKNDK